MATITGAAFRAALCLAAGGLLSACTSTQTTASVDAKAKSTKLATADSGQSKTVYSYTTKDRECLKRAMYFESKRTSEKGFIAVGSVVMNRLTSGIYPSSICGVVTQKNQFAPGVMTRKMDEDTAPDLNKAADAVLKGARHPDVKSAMFFHTKGLSFPYKNMHYVASAGGNVFYEKRGRDGELQTAEPQSSDSYVLAFATPGSAQSAIASVAPSTAPASNQTQTVATAGAASALVPTPASVAAAKGARDASPQLADASKPSVAPIIAAAITRASMEQAFDTAYSVPQNSSVSQAHVIPASLTSDENIPVPTMRPQVQKRPGAGMAMADPPTGLSQQDWTMRTSDWQ
ncbi:Cell Wall Hydrolase [Rhizobium sp. NFR07]|uniref:cell wall hydrolase n=1 Tax=Rhizobium sp. NFR07 TaxID=1566262 RepID=UPI0008E5C428|nr:Cell Wall Hydrolase [Rhizobium sp. NFR07]